MKTEEKFSVTENAGRKMTELNADAMEQVIGAEVDKNICTNECEDCPITDCRHRRT